jgi:hypothetical protein
MGKGEGVEEWFSWIPECGKFVAIVGCVAVAGSGAVVAIGAGVGKAKGDAHGHGARNGACLGAAVVVLGCAVACRKL